MLSSSLHQGRGKALTMEWEMLLYPRSAVPLPASPQGVMYLPTTAPHAPNTAPGAAICSYLNQWAKTPISIKILEKALKGPELPRSHDAIPFPNTQAALTGGQQSPPFYRGPINASPQAQGNAAVPVGSAALCCRSLEGPFWTEYKKVQQCLFDTTWGNANCQFVDSVMLPLPAFPALFGKSSSQSISQAELPHITALHAQRKGSSRVGAAF